MESASLAWDDLLAIRLSVDLVTLCVETVDWFLLLESLLATVPRVDWEAVGVVILGCSGVDPRRGHCWYRLVVTLQQMLPTLEHE